MSNTADFTKRLVQKAGELSLKYYQQQDAIYYKSNKDFALEADYMVEDFLVQSIQKEYPKHNILAEETGEQDNGSDYKWVIDPLDGTVNFKQEIPYFCITVSLQYQGEIILAVVYNPISKELYFAEKGKGAYCNNESIKVSKTDNISNFFVSYSTSNHKNDMGRKNGGEIFTKLVTECRAVRLQGASILDLCYLATGKFDALVKVEASYWDFAAGCLILEEAGGKATDWYGQDWGEDTKYLLASNGKVHQNLLKKVVS